MADNEDHAVELIRKAIENPSLIDEISRAMDPLSRPSSAREVVKTIIEMIGDNQFRDLVETGSQVEENIYA